MPINPEEIIAGAEKIGSVVEKEGGVAKASEAIAAKGEDAVKSAKTYIRDAKGRFTSAAKTAAKTGVASGVGAAVEAAVSSKDSSETAGQQNSQQNGASGNKTIPNPGAYSPAGKIDLPSITPAENLADEVDPSSFGDTRGLKDSSGTNNSGSDKKLNKIISLLGSILSIEKRNLAMMGKGFRNVENAIYFTQQAQLNNQQAQQLENTSSRSGGDFLNSALQNPGKAALNSLKGLGVAALGAFATGAAVDIIKHHGKQASENVHHEVSSVQEGLISKYKEEYGKRWAQKLVADDFSQQQHDKGFLEELANKQGPAALYLPLKEAFDKASKRDKQEIIDAIAALLKISPEKVEKQIAHENIRAVQIAKSAETGVINAAVHAAAGTIGGGIKYGGKAVGWLSSEAGSAFNFFGGYNVGAFLKKEGSTISKNATKKGDELYAKINKGTEYIPSTGKLESFYNPNSYKAGEIGFDAGSAMFVPGVKAKLLFGGAAAGLDLLNNDSDQFGKNTFQTDQNKSHAKLSGTEQERAKKAMAFFLSKGWSKEQAAAIVGNLIQESRLDPNAVNPKSGARGIAQWLGSRVDDFKRQEHTPLEGSSLKSQLDFVNWELNHSEKKAGDKIRATSNTSDATLAVANKYERMGVNESQMGKRISYAEATLKQFDADMLKSKPQIASTAAPQSPTVITQGGTNISRNTTISSASAAAPGYLQDNVTASYSG